MGFLDHLWDETLAGPTPDSGIAKFRKFKALRLHPGGPSHAEENHPISRNITILRSNSLSASSGSSSTPSSPSGAATPGSPFSRKHSQYILKNLKYERDSYKKFVCFVTRFTFHIGRKTCWWDPCYPYKKCATKRIKFT